MVCCVESSFGQILIQNEMVNSDIRGNVLLSSLIYDGTEVPLKTNRESTASARKSPIRKPHTRSILFAYQHKNIHSTIDLVHTNIRNDQVYPDISLVDNKPNDMLLGRNTKDHFIRTEIIFTYT